MNKSYVEFKLVQGSPEWKAARLRHVTASNVAAVLGQSPYKTKLQYFEELISGEEPVVSEAKQKLFDIGHNAEIEGRKWLEQEQGEKFPPMVVVPNDVPCLMASLDGFNVEDNSIFESKYVGAAALSALQKNPGAIPNHHMIQVQAQLLATNARGCHYFAMDTSGESVLVWVTPCLQMMDEIKTEVNAFYADLLDGKAPEPSDADWLVTQDSRFARMFEIKNHLEEMEKEFDKLKEEVAKEYTAKRVRSNGLTMVRSITKGNISYKDVPEIQGVDLEKYRGKSRSSVTIKYDRKTK